jgi:hypothetical protein
MDLVQKLDDFGKPAWITVMVLGFIIFWPVGLAILAYIIWSGRMWNAGACRKSWQEKKNNWQGFGSAMRPSGNRAFDDYKAETLRRLEDEQAEFLSFLERLRKAKDQAEFDQFMADRNKPQASPPPMAG